MFDLPETNLSAMLKKSFTLAALALGAFALSAGSVLAQTGTIEGTVLDGTTSETLPGVNVVIQDLDRGAATDVDGRFEISGVPVGSYTLLASFV